MIQPLPERHLPDALPPGNIWVLGAGRFGMLAVRRLTTRLPRGCVTVIDLRRDRLDAIRREIDRPGVSLCQGDALAHMDREDLDESLWVVPAVPKHVAFLWLVDRLKRVGSIEVQPVPSEADDQVPNPYRTQEGTVYASHATFLCPDSCSEPEEICTHTKLPRPRNLFEILEGVEVEGYRVIVVRSQQLAPGVGGYPVSRLQETLGLIRANPGPWIVATSCRCHSVINAMTWKSQPSG